jgi:hypothetical protein
MSHCYTEAKQQFANHTLTMCSLGKPPPRSWKPFSGVTANETHMARAATTVGSRTNSATLAESAAAAASQTGSRR